MAIYVKSHHEVRGWDMKLLSWLLSKLPTNLLISAILKNNNVAAINVQYWRDVEIMAREVEPQHEYH